MTNSSLAPLCLVTASSSLYFIIGPEAMLWGKYWNYFRSQFRGVRAFGYNSADSKLIWMKSGALWVHCRWLAGADPGRDPRSSDSLRRRRNFFLCPPMSVSLIFRTISQQVRPSLGRPYIHTCRSNAVESPTGTCIGLHALADSSVFGLLGEQNSQNGRFPALDNDEPPCKIWRR